MITLSIYTKQNGCNVFWQPAIRMIEKNLTELVEDYPVCIEGENFIIPKGFKFDGASVPRALWSITGICPFGYVLPAAIIHDWIYTQKGKIDENISYTRKQADEIFVQHLIDLDLINPIFEGGYRAVLRVFGTPRWGVSTWNEIY